MIEYSTPDKKKNKINDNLDDIKLNGEKEFNKVIESNND